MRDFLHLYTSTETTKVASILKLQKSTPLDQYRQITYNVYFSLYHPYHVDVLFLQ